MKIQVTEVTGGDLLPLDVRAEVGRAGFLAEDLVVCPGNDAGGLDHASTSSEVVLEASGDFLSR